MATMTKKTAAKKPTARGKRAPNIGDEIIQGLREAIAFERGDRRGAKVDVKRRTARESTATAAPTVRAKDVASIREKLGLSQPVFAHALNVSPATVRAWEQERKTPGGPALRLLEIAKQHPAIIAAAVHDRPRTSSSVRR